MVPATQGSDDAQSPRANERPMTPPRPSTSIPRSPGLSGPRYRQLMKQLTEYGLDTPTRERLQRSSRPPEVRFRNALTYRMLNVGSSSVGLRKVAAHLKMPHSTLQEDLRLYDKARVCLQSDLATRDLLAPDRVKNFLSEPYEQARRREREHEHELVMKTDVRSRRDRFGILKMICDFFVAAVDQEIRWRAEVAEHLKAGKSWGDVLAIGKYGLTSVSEARRRLHPRLGGSDPRWTMEELSRVRLEEDPGLSLVDLLRLARNRRPPATYRDLAWALEISAKSVWTLCHELGVAGKPATPVPPTQRAIPGGSPKGIPKRPPETLVHLLETPRGREARLAREWEPYGPLLPTLEMLWDSEGYPGWLFGPWVVADIHPIHLEWIRRNRRDLDTPRVIETAIEGNRVSFPAEFPRLGKPPDPYPWEGGAAKMA